MPTIQAIRGDITTLSVMATVNVANESLHGCEPGGAKIMPGFNLQSKFAITTVSPVWQGGNSGEAEILASCYRQCIKLAEQHNISSIAFPAISTGTFGYPLELATEIAIATVSLAVQGTTVIGEVIFCCYSKAILDTYRAILMQPP